MNKAFVRSVLGVPILFQCEGDAIESAIKLIYSQKTESSDVPLIHIELKKSTESTTEFSYPPCFKISEHKIEGCSGNNYFIADRQTRQGFAQVCERMLFDEYLLRHQVLNTLCFYLIAHHYRTPIHAASFILNESLIICIGESGAGKSTLAMAAFKRGLKVLAEDICFIASEPNYKIFADCREIHLNADSFQKFNSISDDLPRLTHNGKQKYVVSIDPHLRVQESSDENVIVLLMKARSKNPASVFQHSRDSHILENLLTPDEEGFKLFSENREKAIRWLGTNPVFEVTPGSCFTDFLTQLKIIEGQSQCVTL